MRTAICVVLSLSLAATACAQWGLWCEGGDEIRVELDGTTVTIFHDAALYFCCDSSIRYEVSWEPDRLVVSEIEVVSPECECICCYDLHLELTDAPSGTRLIWYRWIDWETDTWINWYGEIDVPDMGQGHPPGGDEFLESDCIENVSRERQAWGALKSCYR